jgi:hypothetical protein
VFRVVRLGNWIAAELLGIGLAGGWSNPNFFIIADIAFF